MIGKITSVAGISILGIAALSDFIMIYHGRLDQFGFLALSFGLVALCAAIFIWRHWHAIYEAYTYLQTTDGDGVQLPRAAWSERLGMGALFNSQNRAERRPADNDSNR